MTSLLEGVFLRLVLVLILEETVCKFCIGACFEAWVRRGGRGKWIPEARLYGEERRVGNGSCERSRRGESTVRGKERGSS